MPEPGKSTYAAQQPTHSGKYALRTEPFEIPPGYGGTRPGAKVEPVYIQPIEVVEANDKKVRFLRHKGQETEEMVLRNIGTEGRTPLWTIHNVTKNRTIGEGQNIPDYKPKYNEISPNEVDVHNSDQILTAKIDGAHTITTFSGPDRFNRVFSYRPTQRQIGLIEHTFKFPEFQKMRSGEDIKGTMIRTEAWASKDGKAIPVQQLGGILNSSVPKARRKMDEEGIKLHLTGIDVIKYKGKDFENKSFAEKLDVLKKVHESTGGKIGLPPIAITPDDKKKLMEDIKSGKLSETKEGVVIQSLSEAKKPIKAVFKPTQDVYVRDVFTKEKGLARGHAGGFKYSYTPDGKVIGNVGTGFDFKTKKDMLENPEKYIGRVARVESKESYQNRIDPTQAGVLRAPSFKGWHIDKTDPELMKEAFESVYDEISNQFDPENIVGLSLKTRQGKLAKSVADIKPVKKEIGFIHQFYHKLTGKRDDKSN
jgi:hypothetical protein